MWLPHFFNNSDQVNCSKYEGLLLTFSRTLDYKNKCNDGFPLFVYTMLQLARSLTFFFLFHEGFIGTCKIHIIYSSQIESASNIKHLSRWEIRKLTERRSPLWCLLLCLSFVFFSEAQYNVNAISKRTSSSIGLKITIC